MMGIAELAGEYHRSVELLEDRLKQRIELLRFELVDTRETERILHDYYN